MRFFLPFATAAILAAQSPEVIRLARIKLRAQENLSGLPNYTCTQTIERSQRRAKSRRFQLVDTIRLEVALVAGKELFAWPGQNKFDDRELRDMVGGTIGNGTFGLHARSVFLSNVPTYEFLGEEDQAGRKIFRYRYRVPRFRSGYTLRSNEIQGVAGYHGTFDVDARTFDLIRLEVEAEDIPTNLPISAARDEMFYTRVKIGAGDFLLPQTSTLTLADLEGSESRNRTTFAGCRQYSGESTISFDDPPDPKDVPPPTVLVELPTGLLLETTLVTPIGLDPAIIGDPIEVRLVSDAKLKGRTMVPRGAVARGRLVTRRKFYQRVESMMVVLELTALEFPGARAEIHAVPTDLVSIAAGGVRTAVDKQGIIYIYGSRRELPRGMRITWQLETLSGDPAKGTGRQTQ